MPVVLSPSQRARQPKQILVHSTSVPGQRLQVVLALSLSVRAHLLKGWVAQQPLRPANPLALEALHGCKLALVPWSVVVLM
jgi:hypothetical protein